MKENNCIIMEDFIKYIHYVTSIFEFSVYKNKKINNRNK